MTTETNTFDWQYGKFDGEEKTSYFCNSDNALTLLRILQ